MMMNIRMSRNNFWLVDYHNIEGRGSRWYILVIMKACLKGDFRVGEDRDVDAVCLERVAAHITVDVDCGDGRWHISQLHSDNVVKMAWTKNLQEINVRLTADKRATDILFLPLILHKPRRIP